jgi:negative regulator of flagellin synthesis FlgM
MDIRSSLDGLRSLLGVPQTSASSAQQVKQGQNPSAGSFSADHATLSSVGSLVYQAMTDDGVRMDKVAGVQAALAAGTYDVPASAVASKLIDSMLAGGR